MEEKLQNCFSYIFLLFNLYEDGIANVDEKMSKRQRVAHLITTLGRKLEETAFTEFDQFKLNILLTLLIETCKPYIEFIDQVIKGNLKDPFEEFIIERNRSLNSEDEFFWENVLILHEVDDYFLFKSLLNHVLSAGKSVEILGKLRLIDEYQSEKNEKNLYNVYVENLFQSLSIKTKHKNIPNPKTMHSEDLQNFNLWMSKITKPNTLLNINFKKFLINDDDDHEEYDEPIPAKVIDILDAEFESTKPLSVVLINCLIPHVVERCRSSNQKALQVLVDDYDLLEHLDLVRAFYLLENGDAMFDFCSRIFKKLLRGKIWENSFGLNSYLEEVVESGGFTKFSQKLKISIIKPEKETNITCFLLNELQRIKLDYDVPWPVNIVLNKECIVTFQKIFVFLLQIKCAKYALDNLKFSENCKTNKNQHLLHMMRMKLLCTINSIHSYFMIRILHTTRLKLRQEILQATNVKELVDVHQIYMQTLLEMCFLMPHLNYIKNGVLRIMSLSLEFVKYWNVDLSDERMFMLYEMEKRYNKITKYFSILMRMAQKKGECLNSTFLALDFITSNTELNVFPNSYETCD